MSLNEFTNSPVLPLVEEFGRYLVYPYRWHFEEYKRQYPQEYWQYADYPHVTPNDFVRSARVPLDHIRTRGAIWPEIANFIPTRFLSLTGDEIAGLYFSVPIIVRAGFPQNFADDFEERWDEVLKYWGYKEDLPAKTVAEIKPIEKQITSAVMGKVLIIDGAEDIISNLDWGWALGDRKINDSRIRKFFQNSYPHILNNEDFNSPLKVLRRAETNVLKLDSDHSWQIGRSDFLVLIEPTLTSAQATFLRDWLCIYAPEQIALRLGLHPDDAEGISAKFLMTNKGMGDAMQRIMGEFIPEIGL